jgi:hypothetical protein
MRNNRNMYFLHPVLFSLSFCFFCILTLPDPQSSCILATADRLMAAATAIGVSVVLF